MLIYAIALLGLNLLTGYQRPDFARPRRVLRDRRLWRGDPDRRSSACPIGSPIPLGERGLLRRRLPVRLSGAAARRALSGARDLRARGRDAADPRLQGLRRLDRRRRRAPQLAKPHAPFGLPLNDDQWLYLVCLVCGGGCFFVARNLVSEPRRARAGRDPRSSDRGRDDGRQRGALQDDLLRRQRALRRRRGGLERDRGRLRLAGQFRARAVARFLVGIVVGGLASIGGAIFGALFIEFVPNFADQLSVSFGESAKALPGAIYGVLLILIDGGRRRRASRARCARCSCVARTSLESAGGLDERR